ncbi:hypothetical protein CTEN210_11583 [Chaetoceros tenuissimus]|uniref:HSF-type DNA-binding domain-containing protein n=1 Tax=Chaetoceros tenuissimus TaxID=426638 RepID=A0AAD3CZI6_9STRA|nr:hypothetical protein CTEN210_11583 [Chaetoceros tenuissimus]
MMPYASSYPPYNTPTPAPAPSSEGEQQQVVYVPVLVPANSSTGAAASSAAALVAAAGREAAMSRQLPPPHSHVSATLGGRGIQPHMPSAAPDQFEVASILAGISRNPDDQEEAELAAARGGLRGDSSKQQGQRPDPMLSDQKTRLAHTLDSLNLAQLRRLEEEERVRARLAMLQQGGSLLYPSAHSLLMGAPISEQALFARSLNPSIYQNLLASQGALDPLSARVQALSRENPAFSTTRELAAAKAAATARSQQYPEDSSRPPRSFDRDAYREEIQQFQRDVPKISTKGGVKAPFPVNLWNMLHHIENFEPQLARVISWQPDGLCFRVHDKKRFEESAQARFFGSQVNYTSFRRQLNLWGFKRINDRSINHGAYFHPKFQRHGKYLCRTMVRPQKSKADSSKNTESNTTEE